MQTFSSRLIYQGKRFQINQFVEEIKQSDKPAQWLLDITQFLEDWFDESATLTLDTSGSTGKPKQIVLTKEEMRLSAQATLDYLELEQNLFLLALPTKYVGGKMMLVRAFLHGVDVLLTEPRLHIDFKGEEQKVALLALTPAQFEASYQMLQHTEIQTILLGGAPLSESQKDLANTLNARVFETYGMTETASHIALKEVGKSDYFTPLPGIELTRNSEECLKITGNRLSAGTLETNDRVEFSDTGGFKILGRRDFVINSGGLKIQPEEVEKVLGVFFQTPILIVPETNETLGQEPVLLVESNLPKNIEIPLGKVGIEKNKLPRKVKFIDEFERSESGKILRYETASKAQKIDYLSIIFLA